MSDNSCKCKIVSWISGVLGVFALIAGIGAIVATVTYVGREAGGSGRELIGPSIQTVFATLMIVGSLLMYKGYNAGKRIILGVVLALLGFVVIDDVLYFRKVQDYAYILSSFLLHIIPLTVLLFVTKSVSIK